MNITFSPYNIDEGIPSINFQSRRNNNKPELSWIIQVKGSFSYKLYVIYANKYFVSNVEQEI